MPHAAREHADLRMAFKKPQLPPKPLRSHPIIRIHPRDDLATSRSAKACFARQYYRFAMGNLEAAHDLCALSG